MGFRLAAKDVFLNIAGGIRVSDPALDLGIDDGSSLFKYRRPDTHEYRVCRGKLACRERFVPVSRIEQRILEAEKLGFQQIFVPAGNKKALTKVPAHIKVRFVSRVGDICRELFS